MQLSREDDIPAQGHKGVAAPRAVVPPSRVGAREGSQVGAVHCSMVRGPQRGAGGHAVVLVDLPVFLLAVLAAVRHLRGGGACSAAHRGCGIDRALAGRPKGAGQLR